MSSILEPRNLVFCIGSPGACKGPMCREIAKDWGWAHISVGDEVRYYCDNGEREEDDPIVQAKKKSEPVPDEYLTRILNDRIKELKQDGYDSFIIDGLPRNVDQIPYIHEHVGKPGRVLFMDCPKDVAKRRVLTRRYAERGNTDTEEHFERRFTEFEANNPAIVEHYEAFRPSGQLIKIDGGERLNDNDDNVWDRNIRATEAALTESDQRPDLNVPDHLLE